MNAREQQVEMGNPEKRLDEARAQRDEQDGTEKPEVTEEHKKKAKEMAKAYDDDRPTVAMPDTGGTVSGTAVSGWAETKKGDEAEKH
jgi:hypothetical protein